MNRDPWPQHYEISIRGCLGEAIGGDTFAVDGFVAVFTHGRLT